MLQTHTTTMSDIADILQTVIIDDSIESSSDEDYIGPYFISEVLSKNNMNLSTILKWECELARLIDILRLRGKIVKYIDISNLMINDELQLLTESISYTYCPDNTLSDIAQSQILTIETILTLHTSIFELLFSANLNEQYSNQIKMLYTISNFYYFSSIKVESSTPVCELIKSMDHLCLMVEVGFIDQVCTLFKLITP